MTTFVTARTLARIDAVNVNPDGDTDEPATLVVIEGHRRDDVHVDLVVYGPAPSMLRLTRRQADTLGHALTPTDDADIPS